MSFAHESHAPESMTNGQKLITYLCKKFLDDNDGVGVVVSVTMIGKDKNRVLHVTELDDYLLTEITGMDDAKMQNIFNMSPKALCGDATTWDRIKQLRRGLIKAPSQTKVSQP